MRNRRRGGRMRYAPTHVRLWIDVVGLILDVLSWVSWFEFSRMRCISPVHTAYHCWWNAYSSPWRAYAIRPYTCSVVRVCGRTHFRCALWVLWFEISRITVGAYRIRPHVRELGVICRWMETNFVEWEHIRRHGGRMRYAPTLVRLWGYAVGLILDVLCGFCGLKSVE